MHVTARVERGLCKGLQFILQRLVEYSPAHTRHPDGARAAVARVASRQGLAGARLCDLGGVRGCRNRQHQACGELKHAAGRARRPQLATVGRLARRPRVQAASLSAIACEVTGLSSASAAGPVAPGRWRGARAFPQLWKQSCGN